MRREIPASRGHARVTLPASSSAPSRRSRSRALASVAAGGASSQRSALRLACPTPRDRAPAARDPRRRLPAARTPRDCARRPRPRAGNTRPAPCGRHGPRAAPPRRARCAALRGDSCRSTDRTGCAARVPASTTMRTPSMVRLVSAMLVASTILRRPGLRGLAARHPVRRARARRTAASRPRPCRRRSACPARGGSRPRRAGTPACRLALRPSARLIDAQHRELGRIAPTRQQRQARCPT